MFNQMPFDETTDWSMLKLQARVHLPQFLSATNVKIYFAHTYISIQKKIFITTSISSQP